MLKFTAIALLASAAFLHVTDAKAVTTDDYEMACYNKMTDAIDAGTLHTTTKGEEVEWVYQCELNAVAAHEANQRAKVAQEAKRQEQQQQTQAVNVYTIIDVMQDPILKDQLNYCESQPDLNMIITQAREEYNGAMAIYTESMKQMLQGGATMQDVDAQVGYIRDNANTDIKFTTERVKKLANRCTVQNFGWKRK